MEADPVDIRRGRVGESKSTSIGSSSPASVMSKERDREDVPDFAFRSRTLGFANSMGEDGVSGESISSVRRGDAPGERMSTCDTFKIAYMRVTCTESNGPTVAERPSLRLRGLRSGTR